MRLMQERNVLWQQHFGVRDCPFHWDINTATIEFRRDTDEVIASVCVVGTTSVCEGTFRWGWTNESIPSVARRRLELVREFGARHDFNYSRLLNSQTAIRRPTRWSRSLDGCLTLREYSSILAAISPSFSSSRISRSER